MIVHEATAKAIIMGSMPWWEIVALVLLVAVALYLVFQVVRYIWYLVGILVIFILLRVLEIFLLEPERREALVLFLRMTWLSMGGSGGTGASAWSTPRGEGRKGE